MKKAPGHHPIPKTDNHQRDHRHTTGKKKHVHQHRHETSNQYRFRIHGQTLQDMIIVPVKKNSGIFHHKTHHQHQKQIRLE